MYQLTKTFQVKRPEIKPIVCYSNLNLFKFVPTKQGNKMARIFITGSADGLGQLAAKALVIQGHQVVLHARNKERAKEALANVPCAETSLAADLSSMGETNS
jgi:D-arabinose 1-dehydrogenase-like Zn-dependent alcohol dehydrogenase